MKTAMNTAIPVARASGINFFIAKQEKYAAIQQNIEAIVGFVKQNELSSVFLFLCKGNNMLKS